MRQVIALTAIIAALLSPASADRAVSLAPRDNARNGSIPVPVRLFLRDAFTEAQEERGKMDDPTDVTPEFTLLYCVPIGDPASASRAAFVVGYCIGRSGSGSVPINRCAIVDDVVDRPAGKRRMPDRWAGDDVTTFEWARGVWAIASSYHEGRHPSNSICVFSIGAKEPSFVYRPLAGTVSWYSTLYFIDTDGDGVTEIWVKRLVRDFAARRKWHEYIVFKPARGGETPSWDAGRLVGDEEFRRQIEPKKDDIPRIEQYGMPFDAGVDAELVDVTRTSATPKGPGSPEKHGPK